MSYEMTNSVETFLDQRTKFYRSIGVMGASAVSISAAMIYFFDMHLAHEQLQAMYSQFEIAAMTLMPYLFSAVVAAITAIAVMTSLPSVRLAEPTGKLLERLREASAGNLGGKIKIHGDVPLKDVAQEMNATFSNLSITVSNWKLLDRQQWGILCRLRLAAEGSDMDTVLTCVAEMEQNFDKIAEIEERLVT